MTRSQFRWILVSYVAVVGLGFIVSDLSKHLIPMAIRETNPYLPQMPLAVRMLLFTASTAILGAGITGIIGMFCFWPPARATFLVATVLKILLTPAIGGWMVITRWTNMFYMMELLLDGVILVLCLAGPAKYLFQKRIEQSGAGYPPQGVGSPDP